MIKFKNIYSNIGLINFEVKMQKPQKKQVVAIAPINKGEIVSPQKVEFDTALIKNAVEKPNTKKLTEYLQSAFNNAHTLTKWIPKIADEVAKKIVEYKATLNADSIILKDQKRFDTFSELRKFCYKLVGYDRSQKNNINKAFEMVVERSIRAGLMMVNKVASLQVKDGELLGVSKDVKPTIPQKNINKKIKKKFIDVKNLSNEMIELTTQSIDDLWRRTYGTGGGTTEKTNISASATRFYNDLHKLWNWANEKNYEKFYSNISESSLETILNVGSLISDNKIRDTFKYCENNLQANGSIKKASK